MKKILLIACLLTVTGLCSCNYQSKIDAATSKSDSLQMVIAGNAEIINAVFRDIDEIANTLNQITEREKIVVKTSEGEINPSVTRRISENISAISALLEKNRATINRLSASAAELKKSKVNITSLDSLVSSLQRQIDQKDSQIAEMSDNLAKLKTEITELGQLNAVLSQQKTELEDTVSKQTADLNAVYWIMGSKKELAEKGIIGRKGIVGQVIVLNDVSDLKNFTKGDLREIENIPIDKKGVKIVTSHPSDSYRLIMTDKNNTHSLVIRDKHKFWETSKILVITYK